MAKKKKPTPTYEEFREAVKKWLVPMLKNVDEADIDDYLTTVDAAEELRTRYDAETKAYEAGEITYEVLMGGVVGSVGNCLYMLYE